ncbi:MAG: MBL fold metallo-hydrolase [Actinomycetota bacterium]|nr:MBL fold metallo-hydrolase [Actinomycetota bacterium]
MTIKIFHHQEVGPLACNCYIVGDPTTKEAIVIDPGGDADDLLAALVENELRVTAIVATHAHFDHVIAAEELRAKTGAPFHLHADDHVVLDWFEESGRLFLGVKLPPPPEVDGSPAEGDKLRVGSEDLEVLHTPGHSPGSISLHSDGVLFSGDTLFAGSIGRTDLPGGDTDTLVRAVRSKLFELPEETRVYPGHGPQSTLDEEKRFNPFVGTAARLWIPPE